MCSKGNSYRHVVECLYLQWQSQEIAFAAPQVDNDFSGGDGLSEQ